MAKRHDRFNKVLDRKWRSAGRLQNGAEFVRGKASSQAWIFASGSCRVSSDKILADPNVADWRYSPARAYTIRPPTAVPVAPTGAVPDASIITPPNNGAPSVWATDDSPARADNSASSTRATHEYPGQVDVGR
jgi:hypothetical protein